MSLSKLGLPAATAGLSSPTKIITATISSMNGIISLAPGGIGPAMMCEMIKRRDLLRLSGAVIKPLLLPAGAETIAIIRRYLPERCLIHKPGGRSSSGCGLDLPISTELLYQRLARRL